VSESNFVSARSSDDPIFSVEVQGDPMMKDAFDLWREWATTPADSMREIDADIYNPVMSLSPEDRRDRAKVNEAVRRYREKKE
jgi:hypothetical protein